MASLFIFIALILVMGRGYAAPTGVSSSRNLTLSADAIRTVFPGCDILGCAEAVGSQFASCAEAVRALGLDLVADYDCVQDIISDANAGTGGVIPQDCGPCLGIKAPSNGSTGSGKKSYNTSTFSFGLLVGGGMAVVIDLSQTLL